ncbi:hypothetical protein NDU88_003838 [Pleurodeles waltl]|uniref:Uncharacterized protein n=1 Tax=Pleurodeles waltl TaxID=8319 RepID=A0AAV7V2N5_PLEWA|nr:hypothetical protein NDU88_003838 [Pleurodeles waltl]
MDGGSPRQPGRPCPQPETRQEDEMLHGLVGAGDRAGGRHNNCCISKTLSHPPSPPLQVVISLCPSQRSPASACRRSHSVTPRAGPAGHVSDSGFGHRQRTEISDYVYYWASCTRHVQLAEVRFCS